MVPVVVVAEVVEIVCDGETVIVTLGVIVFAEGAKVLMLADGETVIVIEAVIESAAAATSGICISRGIETRTIARRVQLIRFLLNPHHFRVRRS